MTAAARTYLANRFRADADALDARVRSLATGVKAAGPDAEASRRMAIACRDVVGALETFSAARDRRLDDDARQELHDLATLVPVFELRAAAETAQPAVRAVYMGAATRIREILAAELRAGVMDDADDHAAGDVDGDDDE